MDDEQKYTFNANINDSCGARTIPCGNVAAHYFLGTNRDRRNRSFQCMFFMQTRKSTQKHFFDQIRHQKHENSSIQCRFLIQNRTFQKSHKTFKKCQQNVSFHCTFLMQNVKSAQKQYFWTKMSTKKVKIHYFSASFSCKKEHSQN